MSLRTGSLISPSCLKADAWMSTNQHRTTAQKNSLSPKRPISRSSSSFLWSGWIGHNGPRRTSVSSRPVFLWHPKCTCSTDAHLKSPTSLTRLRRTFPTQKALTRTSSEKKRQDIPNLHLKQHLQPNQELQPRRTRHFQSSHPNQHTTTWWPANMQAVLWPNGLT